MQKICVIIAAAIIGIWMLGLFLGYVTGLGKKLRVNTPPSALSSEELKSKQQRMAEETEEQRRRLMDDYKQRLSDTRRGL